MDFNLPDIKRIADALEEHLKLAKEDLAFRREQAAKSDAAQQSILQTMFGGVPQSQPLEIEGGSVELQRNIPRRRRGEHQL